VYGPDITAAAPNGSIKLATTNDFGASFTTELIWNDDSVLTQPTGDAQYIIENFNQLNSMYTQDGVYHIVYGAVQGIVDTLLSSQIDMFPILYWNDRDRQMVELTSQEAGRPSDSLTQANLANFRPGNGLGNAYPHISEGPNPGELLVVWQQWEDDGSGGLVTVIPSGGSEIFCTDIWYSYSNDGGVTWTTPEYLTGTAGESDVYPNIPEKFVWNATSDSVYIDLLWMWDTEAGTSLFAGGNNPSEAVWQYERFAVPATPATGIDNPQNVVSSYMLEQNYPNPFNPSTTIAFEIQKTENVKIEIYNTLGEKVATVLNDRMNAGPHEITFDASNLASGVYVYRMTAGDAKLTRKMMLLK
jgi:hypothetical protein